MKKLIVLVLALLPALSFHPGQDFRVIYGASYQEALDFCTNNKDLIEQKAKAYGCDAAVLTSIAFPELIRYNRFQNLFETAALELGYVEAGLSVADFSIGVFQMKPSFLEQLEQLVENAPEDSWAIDFQSLCSFDAGDETAIRQQRLSRLKDINWQLDYLACFYKYTETRLSDKSLTTKQKVQHLATWYNCGPSKSMTEIKKWMTKRCFPYGTSQPENKQQNYAAIAVDFYTNIALVLF